VIVDPVSIGGNLWSRSCEQMGVGLACAPRERRRTIFDARIQPRTSKALMAIMRA